jgi:hypothetical protein
VLVAEGCADLFGADRKVAPVLVDPRRDLVSEPAALQFREDGLQTLGAENAFQKTRQGRLLGLAEDISDRAFEGIAPAHGFTLSLSSISLMKVRKERAPDVQVSNAEVRMLTLRTS